jgi:hypothetical protein
MTFQSHLENLRAKPEHVRKNIAFWTSLGVTAIIFMFWLGSFSVTGTTQTGSVANAVNKAGSPGSYLLAGVGDLFGDVKEMIFGTKKIKYSEVEVRGGDR